jgi:hypothetical protein
MTLLAAAEGGLGVPLGRLRPRVGRTQELVREGGIFDRLGDVNDMLGRERSNRSS